MSNPILPTDPVASMRTDAEATMFDSCQIGTFSAGASPEPTGTYTWGSAIACGVNYSPTGESDEGSGATLATAEIRLPYATTITGKDIIKVTKRLGVALATAEEFALLGEPKRGMLGLVCTCSRVVGGGAR